MKASRKISIIYSFITIGLILIAGVVFYFFSSGYTQNLYYKYLEEKAHAVAEEEFSMDEVDSITYRNMVLRRKKSIPTSKELFIKVSNHKNAEKYLLKYLNRQQIKELLAHKTVNFEKGQEVGTAFIYDDNTGTFAVVVLSRNPYGEEIGQILGWAILILVLVSAFILYLISRLYAMRMLDRIDQDYQTEKMFVNNASHEINNPLTAIQGECEVALMRDRSHNEYKSSLKSISEETNRIINIMHELLLFSHTRFGNLDTENMENVNMRDFILRLSDDNTEIRIINNFYVFANEELLYIAVKNLLNNARKYSDGSSVGIIIDLGLIKIEDHGIGIPKTDISHIFEPFYRARNTVGVKGNGVGLALAKSILKNFGANIKVCSEEGKGTMMNVVFKKYNIK
nr:HAMP domain-containing histidine kinase [Prevotella sp.]